MFSNRCLVQQLEKYLHRHIHVSDQIETRFLRTQNHQPMIWFIYKRLDISTTFFYWTHREEKLQEFMADFNVFNPNIQFTYESSKKSIASLDLDLVLCNGRL